IAAFKLTIADLHFDSFTNLKWLMSSTRQSWSFVSNCRNHSSRPPIVIGFGLYPRNSSKARKYSLASANINSHPRPHRRLVVHHHPLGGSGQTLFCRELYEGPPSVSRDRRSHCRSSPSP